MQGVKAAWLNFMTISRKKICTHSSRWMYVRGWWLWREHGPLGVVYVIRARRTERRTKGNSMSPFLNFVEAGDKKQERLLSPPLSSGFHSPLGNLVHSRTSKTQRISNCKRWKFGSCLLDRSKFLGHFYWRLSCLSSSNNWIRLEISAKTIDCWSAITCGLADLKSACYHFHIFADPGNPYRFRW